MLLLQELKKLEKWVQDTYAGRGYRQTGKMGEEKIVFVPNGHAEVCDLSAVATLEEGKITVAQSVIEYESEAGLNTRPAAPMPPGARPDSPVYRDPAEIARYNAHYTEEALALLKKARAPVAALCQNAPDEETPHHVRLCIDRALLLLQKRQLEARAK